MQQHGRFPPWCLPRSKIFPPPVSSVFHVLILFLISALILSAAPKGSKDLTLSLPKCLMEFCKVTLTLILSLWMKSYDVTIQLKALCLYFHMMLFVCQNFRKWNLAIWSKFPFGDIWHWKGNEPEVSSRDHIDFRTKSERLCVNILFQGDTVFSLTLPLYDSLMTLFVVYTTNFQTYMYHP